MDAKGKNTELTLSNLLKVRSLMDGEEVTIDGVVWCRMDGEHVVEYKISPNPENFDEDCEWVLGEEVRADLRELKC